VRHCGRERLALAGGAVEAQALKVVAPVEVVDAVSVVIQQARVGREVRFSIEAERLGSAAAWLSTVGARWDRRLASLEAHVSSRSTRQD
jgi:hypothetical protein